MKNDYDDPLLTLHFHAFDLRMMAISYFNSNEEIMATYAWEYFDKSFKEDHINTLKWLLYLRDIKCGLGERESFRMLLVVLSKKNIELAMKLFRLDLSSFGRFDDEISIYDKVNSGIQGIILNKISQQLEEDRLLMEEQKPISLLAKWMPSINTSSKRTRHLANILAKDLHLTPRQYRKILAELRKYLNLVEHNLSNKDYESIDYSKVPCLANDKYRQAFIRHDYSKRMEYIRDRYKNGAEMPLTTPYALSTSLESNTLQNVLGEMKGLHTGLIDQLNNERYNCIEDLF